MPAQGLAIGFTKALDRGINDEVDPGLLQLRAIADTAPR
jgi:hypothetical protein